MWETAEEKYPDVYVSLHCVRNSTEVFTEILSFNSYTTYVVESPIWQARK